MDEVVGKLSKCTEIMKEYIAPITEGCEARVVEFEQGSSTVRTGRSDELIRILKENKTPYEVKDLKSELKEKGIGTDWVDAYVKHVGKRK